MAADVVPSFCHELELRECQAPFCALTSQSVFVRQVITSADFHPQSCSIFAFSSSKGCIRLADMREAALCDRHSKAFEELEPQVRAPSAPSARRPRPCAPAGCGGAGCGRHVRRSSLHPSDAIMFWRQPALRHSREVCSLMAPQKFVRNNGIVIVCNSGGRAAARALCAPGAGTAAAA